MAASAPAPQGPAWGLNPLIELHWKIWGEGCLVFEAVSGETAVVDPLDAAALGCFEAGPLGLPALRQALEAELGAALTEEAAAALGVSVNELVAKGWLEPITSPA